MPIERTFIMIKPDAVQRRLVAEVLRRFETRGFRLVGIKLVLPGTALAEAHYAVHKDRPFFPGLVTFLTAGPVVASVWEGSDAIVIGRKMIGALKPTEAVSGTIRGDFTIDVKLNLVHGSDAPETAEYEISLWFKPEELLV